MYKIWLFIFCSVCHCHQNDFETIDPFAALPVNVLSFGSYNRNAIRSLIFFKQQNYEKILQSLILIILLFSGVSCKKYLNVVPDNTGTLDYAFRNRNEAENYLFTCYATLQQFYDPTANVGFTTSSEIIYPNDLTNHPLMETGFSLIRGTQTSGNVGLNFWDGENGGVAIYRSIRRCNTMLENIDKPIDLSPSEKQRWIAEVKFLKAYYHYYLLRLYGPIPIIKTNLDIIASTEQVRVARSPVDSVFSYITQLNFSNYERELSLNNALAKCTYRVNGVNYTREYFTSFGSDISVIKLSADKPGQINCNISISRPERGASYVEGNELQLSGQLNNGTDGKGMEYVAKVKAKLNGGSISALKNTLEVKNATEVIIYISAGTSFKETAFKQRAETILTEALKTPYDTEKRHHINNYQKLFNRVSLSLGDANNTRETTDKRLISFHKKPSADNGLPVLFFQYGRYLSICSTRVGLLPPNLQGLWANQIQTPWNGDYHLDINVEMNHWHLEMANLGELNLPLVELVRGMASNGEKTAKAYYNAKGWVAHVITNPWHFTEPGEDASWGISKSGSGWLCDNIWQHYAFTNDKKYLASIYPILKGSAQFYYSILVKDAKTGWQVTSPSSSPENTFYMANGKTSSICMGATIDNQIIRELFNNVITASKVLGIDEPFRNELTAKLKELPPPGVIAKDGRIQEWLEDYKETDQQHRHISHLYGLYPAPLITPGGTPELAEAAKKTLNVRGDDGPGWSIAYKILFWARLHDGNRAYKLYTELMKPTVRTDINYGSGGGIYPNLLDAGPPFQIDGNFGGAAGIGEMLIQSHAGCIELIPAIPNAWKPYGRVKGLRARGNFTVDMEWKDGKIINYRVVSSSPRKVKVMLNGSLKTIMAAKG